jgi:hypothetical protein
MTETEYVRLLKRLGLTAETAGPVLCISRSTAYRYAAGDPINPTVAKLLCALVVLGDTEVYKAHTNLSQNLRLRPVSK